MNDKASKRDVRHGNEILLGCEDLESRAHELSVRTKEAITYNSVGSAVVEKETLRSIHSGGQILGSLVYGFQVDFLPATSGNHCAILEPDEQTTEGKTKSQYPEHQGCAYGTNRSED